MRGHKARIAGRCFSTRSRRRRMHDNVNTNDEWLRGGRMRISIKMCKMYGFKVIYLLCKGNRLNRINLLWVY